MAAVPIRIDVPDPELSARIADVLATVQVDFPLEVTGLEGPLAPDALWIAIAPEAGDRADAMRRGAADAIEPTALDRLPLAVEHARRAMQLRVLGQVIALSPDAVEITDPQVRYLYVNPAYERLFGVSMSDVFGRTPAALLRAGTHGPSFYEGIEQRIQTGRAWTGSLVTRRGDGVSLQECVIAPVVVAGTIVRHVSIRRDLGTSWLEPLDDAPPRRLREHVERHAVHPWFLHATDGTILELSAEACRLVGASREALLGTALAALEDRTPQTLVEARWRALTAEGIDTVDTVVRTPRGPLPVKARSAAVPLGDMPVVLTVFADNTERTRHEHELERARDEAVRASQEKSEFLANMSHEVRTPLSAIVGYTELLLEEHLPPEAQGDLERIRRSAHHVIGLVDDILDLSRIEARRLKLAFVAVRIAEVVREVLEAVRPAADTSGNALVVVREPPEELVVVTDRRRLAQVLLNLAGNACKFTRDGRVELEVRATPHAVEVVVADDGPGIPEDLVPRLFRPFERAQSARGIAGTGLGLAISHRLARALGGDLRAEQPPKGARFVLTLPR